MDKNCGDEWTDGEITLPICINFMNFCVNTENIIGPGLA
jgi:hypothetical protein